MDDNQIKAAQLEAMKQSNPQAASGAFVHLQHLTQEDAYLYTMLTIEQNGQKIVNQDAFLIFKQVYKPITIFAQEQTYHENGTVSFGQQPNIECRLTGEMVNSAYFTCTLKELSISNIPALENKNKKISYISNLGFSMMSALVDLGIPADCVNSSQNLILQNIMKRYDQRVLMNQMQQSIPQNTRLTQELPQIKIVVPLQLFFNGRPERSLRNYQGNISKLTFEIKIRNIDQLFCYTQNLRDQIENNALFIQNYQTMQKAGIILNEIFVSDSERNAMLEPIGGDTSISEQKLLFEQNLMTKRQINEKQQEISLNTFNHPSKMIYYYVQKKKFISKLPYLYYEPFIEGYDFTQNLLQKATQRFVLKFSTYQAALKTGQTLANGDSVLVAKPKYDFKILPVCIFGSTKLSLINQNLNQIDIQTIYDNLGIMFIDDTKFTTQNIILTSQTLTIEEASIPVDNNQLSNISLYLKSTLPENIAFVSDTTTATTNYFSVYSIGPIFGATTAVKSASFTASSDIFSDLITSELYNEGLEGEDIVVNQWDNFGKNLDGSGEIILISELHNSGLLRYKLNYNYTKNMHPMNYFPGKAPNGVHFYSFALNPEQIQPSGTLSFTKQDLKLIIDCNADIGDILNVGTRVYNFITLKNGVFSIEYNSNIILQQFEI